MLAVWIAILVTIGAALVPEAKAQGTYTRQHGPWLVECTTNEVRGDFECWLMDRPAPTAFSLVIGRRNGRWSTPTVLAYSSGATDRPAEQTWKPMLRFDRSPPIENYMLGNDISELLRQMLSGREIRMEAWPPGESRSSVKRVSLAQFAAAYCDLMAFARGRGYEAQSPFPPLPCPTTRRR